MRERYNLQLEELNNQLIRMGALCEDAISCALKALFDGNTGFIEKTCMIEKDINLKQREIEQLCIRLLLHEQPMASDLRRITAAQNMITDMERVGDQACDIAEIGEYVTGSNVKKSHYFHDMAAATIKMVTDSIDSYVTRNAEKAKQVIAYDDVVDTLFLEIKEELILQIKADTAVAGECLDLLMIAKYLERIGDHAENIAGWVLYFLTGVRADT